MGTRDRPRALARRGHGDVRPAGFGVHGPHRTRAGRHTGLPLPVRPAAGCERGLFVLAALENRLRHRNRQARAASRAHVNVHQRRFRVDDRYSSASEIRSARTSRSPITIVVPALPSCLARVARSNCLPLPTIADIRRSEAIINTSKGSYRIPLRGKAWPRCRRHRHRPTSKGAGGTPPPDRNPAGASRSRIRAM